MALVKSLVKTGFTGCLHYKNIPQRLSVKENPHLRDRPFKKGNRNSKKEERWQENCDYLF